MGGKSIFPIYIQDNDRSSFRHHRAGSSRTLKTKRLEAIVELCVLDDVRQGRDFD